MQVDSPKKSSKKDAIKIEEGWPKINFLVENGGKLPTKNVFDDAHLKRLTTNLQQEAFALLGTPDSIH